MGVFGCFEVTIGWWGKERVDFITYDTNGVWRCYEIKVSKVDFNSKANNTFVGHYNYYVMPLELFDQVRELVPNHIGVYTESRFIAKKAKKQELLIDEQVLKNSLIRSLCREAEKIYNEDNPMIIEGLKRRLKESENMVGVYRKQYQEMKMLLKESVGEHEMKRLLRESGN